MFISKQKTLKAGTKNLSGLKDLKGLGNESFPVAMTL
jgi:hypothetical protein